MCVCLGGEKDKPHSLTLIQVSIRAFFPVWVFLYVIQFLLMPVIARDYWLSLFVGNSLYLVAFGYYFVISFLGYNGTSRGSAAELTSAHVKSVSRLLYVQIWIFLLIVAQHCPFSITQNCCCHR